LLNLISTEKGDATLANSQPGISKPSYKLVYGMSGNLDISRLSGVIKEIHTLGMPFAWFVSVSKPDASKYNGYDQNQDCKQDEDRLHYSKFTQNEL